MYKLVKTHTRSLKVIFFALAFCAGQKNLVAMSFNLPSKLTKKNTVTLKDVGAKLDNLISEVAKIKAIQQKDSSRITALEVPSGYRESVSYNPKRT